MATLGKPDIACNNWNTLGFWPVISTLCCSPCMYGNALAKAAAEKRNDTERAEEYGVLSLSSECCTLTCLSMCIGGFAVCGAGILLRERYTVDGGKNELIPSCLAETFPLCSFAPCQMHEYLQESTLPADLALAY